MENYRICKEIFTDHDGTVYEEIYNYDEGGCLGSVHIEADDGIQREHIYKYNSDGLRVKREDYRRGDIWKYVEYEYGVPIITARGGREKVLIKAVHHDPLGAVKYFYMFVIEEGRLLKQTQYAPDGGIRYEFLCQYENGRRARTLKANLELYSSRIYGENGLLSEIRLFTGAHICLHYEPLPGRFDYDLYTPC